MVTEVQSAVSPCSKLSMPVVDANAATQRFCQEKLLLYQLTEIFVSRDLVVSRWTAVVVGRWVVAAGERWRVEKTSVS